MSDTRIQIGVPQPSSQAPRSESAGREARLTSVSDDIRQDRDNSPKTLRVRGEVVRTRNDGSVRIQTDRGTVEVRLPEGEPLPPKGARVEVEIRADQVKKDGRAQLPDTVTIRNLPTPKADTPVDRATSTPVRVDVQPPAPAAPPPENRQPLPVELRHPESASAIERALPPEGSIVRLQPIPAQAASVLPPAQPLTQIISTIIQSVDFKIQNIAQNALPQTQAALDTILQTPAATPAPEIVSLTPAVTPISADTPVILTGIAQVLPEQAASAPAPIQIAQPLNAAQVFLQNVLSPNAPPVQIASAQIITPPIVQTNIEAAPSQITSLPIPQDGTVAASAAAPLPAFKAQPLNVKIEGVAPPLAQVIAKGEIYAPTPNASLNAHTKPEALILNNQNAATVTGVVTNITTNALPVITVSFPQIGGEQLFALQYPSENVTIGTQVHISPQVSPISAIASTVSPQVYAVPLPVLLAPQAHWPALEDIAQTLMRAAPQTAQAMMNVTPSPNAPAQMGPAALFFIAALRGGDLSQWLGDKAQDALRAAGKAGSITKLTQEGSLLGRVASEPASQDWRALNLPMAWGGDIQKVALYYRHEREASEDDETARGIRTTRFVFDLKLDAMGKVQLDGLFRPHETHSRLDLAVRTEGQFSESTKAEMRRIYAKALRDTQVTGELSFQKPDTWVTIQADESKAKAVSA